MRRDKLQRSRARTPYARKTTFATTLQLERLQSIQVAMIPAEDLQMTSIMILGEGSFGKCTVATYKGHYAVCVKKLKKSATDDVHLLKEARILSILSSHRCIPHCFGVCLSELMLVTSLHTVEGKSLALDEAIESCAMVLEKQNGVKFLYQVATALSYIHDNGYLHNDVKGNNIVLDDMQSGDIQAYLIDFGKACHQTKGKQYYLSADERMEYKVKHPHIAPDLRDGLIMQCVQTDVFGIGRVIGKMCKTRKIPAELNEIASHCLAPASKDRPGMSEVTQALQARL